MPETVNNKTLQWKWKCLAGPVNCTVRNIFSQMFARRHKRRHDYTAQIHFAILCLIISVWMLSTRDLHYQCFSFFCFVFFQLELNVFLFLNITLFMTRGRRTPSTNIQNVNGHTHTQCSYSLLHLSHCLLPLLYPAHYNTDRFFFLYVDQIEYWTCRRFWLAGKSPFPLGLCVIIKD